MKAEEKIALIAVTRKGLDHARLLRQRLNFGQVFLPEKMGAPLHPWEQTYSALSEQTPLWFQQFDQLVFFLAVGAVTRLIARCLVSKTVDPGVLAIDEAGHFVIPVLSGHQGGANAWARRLAGCLGATPIITTASDVVGGWSPDLVSERFGWKAEPEERLKSAAFHLVNGDPVAVIQEVGEGNGWLDLHDLPPNADYAVSPERLPVRDFASVLWITDRHHSSTGIIAENRILWYRPRSLVLGVGCERGISAEALEDGLQQFLWDSGYARSSICLLASVTVKSDESGLLEWASHQGWPLRFFPAEELAPVPVPNPSAMVEQCVGTPGVSEAAALLASASDRLLVEKTVVLSKHSPKRMTFALARMANFETRSGAMGRVIFVGAGPGDPQLLTLKGHQALQNAQVVIYAGSLVPEEILRHAPVTARLYNSASLTLEQTLEIIDHAVSAGMTVVRLQSGDTSLYSAIQEQIAHLEQKNIPYDIIPGISSFQAAAAALRSEFTIPEKVQTIILTRAEGSTPMPSAESLKSLAQHQATLCIFLSARLGEKVQEDLLTAYAPDTPVAILFRVTWPDEKIVVTRLDQLWKTLREEKLTRTTLIVVGQAVGARAHRSQLYDPRHGHIFRRESP